MTRILHTKHALYILIAIGALFGVLFLHFDSSPSLRVKGKEIPVTIADTDTLRAQGLSGTTSLKEGTGKLFMFTTPAVQGFWMKDMVYPIDIVWIDASFQVVGIESAVDPASYPTVFYSPQPVSYVLELNANESAVDNLAIGTYVHLEK